jgi:hypothetical protein
MDPTLSDMERVLVTMRPRPRPEFVTSLAAELEQSLRPRGPRMPRMPRMPRLAMATAYATGLATVVLGLSVAGALPLHLGGAHRAAADRNCTTVTRWQLQRRPVVHVTKGNQLRITDTTVLVPQRVIRCH